MRCREIKRSVRICLAGKYWTLNLKPDPSDDNTWALNCQSFHKSNHPNCNRENFTSFLLEEITIASCLLTIRKILHYPMTFKFQRTLGTILFSTLSQHICSNGAKCSAMSSRGLLLPTSLSQFRSSSTVPLFTHLPSRCLNQNVHSS